MPTTDEIFQRTSVPARQGSAPKNGILMIPAGKTDCGTAELQCPPAVDNVCLARGKARFIGRQVYG